jgi:hypothetical protein
MIGRASFIAIAVLSAGVGAHSLNPRELYNEMYPVETLKRDAFHICRDADPTFVRAVKVDREACYDSMPNSIEVALGRVKPAGALTMAALLDASHQHDLLQILASEPRQPVTAPQTFANTQWTRALAPTCGDADSGSALAALAATGVPPPPGSGRAAMLGTAALPGLPVLPHAAPPAPLSITANEPKPAPTPLFDPIASPDIGDKGPPAIVPAMPGKSCGGV